MNPLFHESGFAKTRLFTGAIFREDEVLWGILERHTEDIRQFFQQVGQELVYDVTEGYAILRQIKIEGEDKVPKLTQRKSFTYEATILLICLREECSRAEAASADSGRLVRTVADIEEMVNRYIPETTDEVKDAKNIRITIKKLVDFGFLKKLEGGEHEAFEITRLVKARITPEELKIIKERIVNYAKSRS